METLLKDQPLNPGEEISIYLSGATAHCAVAVMMLHAKVDRLTEKAVKLVSVDRQAPNCGQSVWLPRKALAAYSCTLCGVTSTTWKIRHWFRPDHYQARFFSRSTLATISA
ncbi:hypothetical protein OpiT1DRAFT_03860 [Opitutaceae bacterium TAV1]|nr:hypothetical protein OpiT1DRAFT_03860 [Opitutaceae bacterium TAV1]